MEKYYYFLIGSIFIVFIIDIMVGIIALWKNRSFFLYFFLSLFLSPLISLIILAIVISTRSKDKILDDEYHIFYCPNCDATFSDIIAAACPNCRGRVLESTILLSEWKRLTEEEKDNLCLDFMDGIYLRNSGKVASGSNKYSTADEIRKYKELLDTGVITEEEFRIQKEKLLNL